ncbi:MAG: hypothetical protein OXM55_01935 [Bdellovibrionales bacterium]|nr:hypothetical protein [Bdellovibrionales bacterium]
MKAVFMEYFWDMSWCDPCAAEPLTQKELKGLGVFWLDSPSEPPGSPFLKSLKNLAHLKNPGGRICGSREGRIYIDHTRCLEKMYY